MVPNIDMSDASGARASHARSRIHLNYYCMLSAIVAASPVAYIHLNYCRQQATRLRFPGVMLVSQQPGQRTFKQSQGKARGSIRDPTPSACPSLPFLLPHSQRTVSRTQGFLARARGEFAGSSHPTGALNVLYSRAQDLAARPVHSAPATQSLASRPQSYRTQGFRDPSEAVPADERSTARSAENYHP